MYAQSSRREIRHSRAAVENLIRDHFAHSVPSHCLHHAAVILVQNLRAFEGAFMIENLLGKSAEVCDWLCFNEVEGGSEV